jgi:hypothetical protein
MQQNKRKISDRLNNPKRLDILDLQKVISHFKLEGDITLADIGTGAGIFAEAFLKLMPGDAAMHWISG